MRKLRKRKRKSRKDIVEMAKPLDTFEQYSNWMAEMIVNFCNLASQNSIKRLKKIISKHCE